MKRFIYWLVKFIIVLALLFFVQSFTDMTIKQILIFDCIAFIGIDLCSWIKSYEYITR